MIEINKIKEINKKNQIKEIINLVHANSYKGLYNIANYSPEQLETIISGIYRILGE